MNRLGHTATKSSQDSLNQTTKRQRTDRDKPFLSRGYPNIYTGMEVPEVSSVQLLVQEGTVPRDREKIARMISLLDNLQVNEFLAVLPLSNEFLARQCFKAGRLAAFLHSWRQITTDAEILHMVSGQHIEFCSKPGQSTRSNGAIFSDKERSIIDSEIHILLEKGVIVTTTPEPGEFISSIFVRPQIDGTYRMILNLKNLNKHVEDNHFKMETLEGAIGLMRTSYYTASIDLKEAYYSVPNAKEHLKYLKFKWGHTLFQFTCFPNGLSFRPRKFTKLLKPVYSVPHKQGHLSCPYIDDSYLQGTDYGDCEAKVIASVRMFISLGFIVHPTKSVFWDLHLTLF